MIHGIRASPWAGISGSVRREPAIHSPFSAEQHSGGAAHPSFRASCRWNGNPYPAPVHGLRFATRPVAKP
jgi:hypothetical protein